MIVQEPDARPIFPPQLVMQVKALACEIPWLQGIPLSRFSSNDIATEIIQRGIVAHISGSTVWRWLDEDAIKPWQHRSWIFPRDPAFEEKAARVLDLYQGMWQGCPLQSNEYVISADEKTSIQARARKHPSLAPAPGLCTRVEHEYERKGSLCYLAAWDVRRAKVFGHCEETSGIQPFDRLVAMVMNREPYRSADRVFWIVDNGSSHRGPKAVARLRERWPRLVLVHLPIHASWLNQIEIYFSIVQRKALTPNDNSTLQDLAMRIMRFQQRFEEIAKPFEWKFTRHDLNQLMGRLLQRSAPFTRSA
jgi:transposase